MSGNLLLTVLLDVGLLTKRPVEPVGAFVFSDPCPRLIPVMPPKRALSRVGKLIGAAVFDMQFASQILQGGWTEPVGWLLIIAGLALATWTDATHHSLTCPRCGIEETITT